MKKKFSLIVFLMLLSTLNAQVNELERGTLITYQFDTLTVNMHVLSEAQSILLIKYVDKYGKTKRLSTKKVKSYQRGIEKFKTITISENYKLFAKEILKGKNFSLYRRVEGDSEYLDIPNGTVAYLSLFIENNKGKSMKVPLSKKRFSKLISKFVDEFPKVSEKVRKGELTDIIEIINLCNYIYSN